MPVLEHALLKYLIWPAGGDEEYSEFTVSTELGGPANTPKNKGFGGRNVSTGSS